MDEAQRSAWCRENGVYPTELQLWKENATAALSEAPEERISAQQSREAKKRIKELERDLRRKDKALAETTALLVLSKMYGLPPAAQGLLFRSHTETVSRKCIRPVSGKPEGSPGLDGIRTHRAS